MTGETNAECPILKVSFYVEDNTHSSHHDSRLFLILYPSISLTEKDRILIDYMLEICYKQYHRQTRNRFGAWGTK